MPDRVPSWPTTTLATSWRTALTARRASSPGGSDGGGPLGGGTWPDDGPLGGGTWPEDGPLGGGTWGSVLLT